MNIKIYLIILVTFFSFKTIAQNSELTIKDSSEFYCLGWVIELPDTIQVFNDYNPIPQNHKYSHIKRDELGKYHFYCWTGEIALETPTQTSGKIKVKFKNEKIIFRVGQKKGVYKLMIQNNKLLLIKEA